MEQHDQDTEPIPPAEDTALPNRPGRAFISNGVGLTLLEEVAWNSRWLRALLSLALADERLTGEGAFAVVRSRTGEGYTARRLHPPVSSPLLRVTLCEGHWIAVGPAGSEPREVFSDGSSRPWDGPVPVEALS